MQFPLTLTQTYPLINIPPATHPRHNTLNKRLTIAVVAIPVRDPIL